MTPEQIELARHALGLTRQKQSYRNYFCAGPDHSDHAEWMKMVSEGDAIVRGDTLGMRRGDNLFHVTRAGAEKALQPGETLDPEDW